MATFSWTKLDAGGLKIKSFLAERGVSHRMFSIIKSGGGPLLLDGRPVTTLAEIKEGQRVTVIMPPEESNDIVAVSDEPIEVLFEDENWLVVNKPAGVTSVPGKADREHTMVNRVKGYLTSTGAKDLVPHVVTRLDRFTSGVALLAKHRFAHGLLDKELKAHAVDKRYYAIVDGDLADDYGYIDAPIGRMDDDFIRREVRADGRASQTEYWVVKRFGNQTLVRVQLHTGRTHQIRVHFKYIGHPLVGDGIYGGPLDRGMDNQALHAYWLQWFDPFAQAERAYTAPVPQAMLDIMDGFVPPLN
ncbi:MAG: RluA family pseudouridine synthase [Lactobacillaceae bacterium]|jgi:23S rRNA pseudouridine1911/1915/1917 synthase|nr:RluA family pseudouridine synthase [Lactobacillaceae bacterium]